MPWTYSQSTGQLKHNGQLVATGYSGAGTNYASGRNNPSLQSVSDTGPIPTGTWQIGTMTNSTQTGPSVLPLSPVGHTAFGRTAFQIHGNNTSNNASHGCVIMPLVIRQQIANSGDPILNVIP